MSPTSFSGYVWGCPLFFYLPVWPHLYVSGTDLCMLSVGPFSDTSHTHASICLVMVTFCVLIRGTLPFCLSSCNLWYQIKRIIFMYCISAGANVVFFCFLDSGVILYILFSVLFVCYEIFPSSHLTLSLWLVNQSKKKTQNPTNWHNMICPHESHHCDHCTNFGYPFPDLTTLPGLCLTKKKKIEPT